MSSKEIVIQFVSKLPEGMPLAEIAREIELLVGIQTAREQARRKEGISVEDARKFVDSWALENEFLIPTGLHLSDGMGIGG